MELLQIKGCVDNENLCNTNKKKLKIFILKLDNIELFYCFTDSLKKIPNALSSDRINNILLSLEKLGAGWLCQNLLEGFGLCYTK